jgi:alpha-beta hydrolase superfamily lysophospholipase
VISSAAHLGNPPVSSLKLAVGRLMSKVWPSLTMDAGLDETAISRDATAVQAYRDDPLIHGKASARLATELENAVAETQANAYRLQPPLLIYFGTDDRLTNPQDSQRFYNHVRSSEKKIIVYEGGQHENHNDIHSERVCIEVSQWIESRVMIASQQQHRHQDSIDG